MAQPGDRTERAALRARQRDEVAAPRGPVPLTTPVASRAQSHGMTGGAVIGAVIGVVLAAPIGLIEWADVSLAGRVLIAAIIGAVAGATAGAVFAGGAAPEVEGEDRSRFPGE